MILYAVNFENDGFVLIAAPIIVTPIIGFAEEGSYGDAQCLSNETFQFFLDNAIRYIENSVETQMILPQDSIPLVITPLFEYDTIAIMSQKNPRVKVKWNQKWLENEFCTNKIAG